MVELTIVLKNVDDVDDTDDAEKVVKYLVKWKEGSYLHTTWEDEEKLIALGGKQRLLNFVRKWDDLTKWEVDDRGGEYFDPSYAEIERVYASKLDVDHKEAAEAGGDGSQSDEEGGGTHTKYLCKWRNLQYSDSTWEKREAVVESVGEEDAAVMLDMHERFCALPDLDTRRRRARPEVVQKMNKSDTPDFVGSCVFKANQLREYQKEGVNWLVYNWVQHRGSILADEMGLGKTVQATGFISWLFQQNNRRGPFLVVAPLSVIPNWLREIEGWTEMNAIVFHGNQQSREAIFKHEFFFTDPETGKDVTRDQDGSRIYKFHVLITTWEVVMNDKDRADGVLSEIPWDAVIVDEAHRLKNKESKTFTSLQGFKAIPPCARDCNIDPAHCVLMTGTPLQNNTEELWCLLHFLAPDAFADLDEFVATYGNPPTPTQVPLCTSPACCSARSLSLSLSLMHARTHTHTHTLTHAHTQTHRHIRADAGAAVCERVCPCA